MTRTRTRTTTFQIKPRGTYSLAQSIRFLEGFTPAAYEGADEGHLHLAFVPDGATGGVGVCVREERGVVAGATYGDAPTEAVRRQVARILSLDVDGSRFEDVGRRDPVIGDLQRRYPGLRPVAFLSPYEAACWALISHRIRIAQASRIKAAIARELGQQVSIHGDVRHAFPAPNVLLRLTSFPGLTESKVGYLRGAAQAALDGILDAERLRGMPQEEAIELLRRIDGIGPFSAGLTLLRGAATPDGFANAEPRFAKAVALAYELPDPPTPEQLQKVAERWRPFRTWATLLLRVNLETRTHEISSGGISAGSVAPPPAG